MPVPATLDALPADTFILGDAVFDRLGQAIVDGTLAPGEVLSDREICRWLGVSKTPVRDALGRLRTIGFVEVQRSRFTRVTALDAGHIAQALEYAAFQAGFAARMAVPRLDDEQIEHALGLVSAIEAADLAGQTQALRGAQFTLVRYLSEQSGNAVFLRVMKEMRLMFHRALHGHTPSSNTSHTRLPHYPALSAAIRDRDADAVERIVRVVLNEHTAG